MQSLSVLEQIKTADISQHPTQQLALTRALIDDIIPHMHGDAAELDTLKNALYPAEGEATSLNTAQLSRTQLDALARFGQLHQLAGHILTHHQLAHSSAPNPELDALLKSPRMNSAEKVVKKINAATLEMSFTGHPTNANGIPFMQAFRDLGAELNKPTPEIRFLNDALRDVATTPLLPNQSSIEGEPEKRSVSQEIDTMLHSIGNIYDDLPQTYAAFDNALSNKFGDRYKPTSLQLPIKLHSWGSSGDKDGNQNVSADSTLLAVSKHKQFVIGRYAEAFETIGEPAIASTLKNAKTQMDSICKKLTDASKAANSTFFLSEGEHEKAIAQLKAIDNNIQPDTLIEAAQKHANTSEGLALLRRLHTFGTHGAKIEYRETAEEFERITGLFIEGYNDMSHEQRSDALSELLSHPKNVREKALGLKLGQYTQTPYNKEGLDGEAVGPIAYNTLKRFALARHFPEMFEKQVLAECQGTHNLLEAVLLQHAAAPEKIKESAGALGIVPLFEEAGTLAEAPNILSRALNNKFYRKHVELTGGMQQVQLAHSDNARRAGMPVARALINKAHREIREGLANSGVDVQFFEGGSQSDVFRGGAFALADAVDTFGLHDFTKFTSQGGDLLNYFAIPQTSARFFSAGLAHKALGPQGRNQGTAIDQQLESGLVPAHKAYDAFFQQPAFGYFMRDIGYNTTSKAGNFSSRAGSRGPKKDVADVTKMRTIGFSETLQHAGITPTWIGARYLDSAFPNQGGAAENARSLQRAMEKSPIMRDAISRIAYGLARTDMDTVEARTQFTTNNGKKPNSEMGDDHPEMGSRQAFKYLRDEYREASKLVLKTIQGAQFNTEAFAQMSDAEIRANIVDNMFPHIKETLAQQAHYSNMAHEAATHSDPGNFTNQALLHNAQDTVYHGRISALDTPAYRQMIQAKSAAVEPARQ